MTIEEEIKDIIIFTLFDYYELISKYGEKEVLSYFKDNDKLNKRFILKYYPVFLMAELSDMEVNDDTINKLIEKYGKNNVINFFLDFLTINYNNKENIFKYKKILLSVIDEYSYYLQTSKFHDNSMEYDDHYMAFLNEIRKYDLLSYKETNRCFSILNYCKNNIFICDIDEHGNISFNNIESIILSIKNTSEVNKLNQLNKFANDEIKGIITKYNKIISENADNDNLFSNYDFIKEKMGFSENFETIDNIGEQFDFVINYMKIREIIFNCNLRLVNTIADHYKIFGLDILELLDEGSIGLLKAIDRFELERGNRFSTFAVDWIKNYITSALAEIGTTIRIPKSYTDNIIKMKNFINKYNVTYGKDPSIDEIANYLDFSEERVKDMLYYMGSINTTSLDGFANFDYDLSLKNVLFDKEKSDFDEIYRSEKIKLVWECLNRLPEKDRDILILRFGLLDDNELTLKKVGNKYNLTRERIRQLEKKAKKSFKFYSKVTGLEDFIYE